MFVLYNFHMQTWTESPRTASILKDTVAHIRDHVAIASASWDARNAIGAPLSRINHQSVIGEDWSIPHPIVLACYPELCAGLKRGLDIVLSMSLLVFLSPVFLLLSLLIVLDSPGSPVFRQ